MTSPLYGSLQNFGLMRLSSSDSPPTEHNSVENHDLLDLSLCANISLFFLFIPQGIYRI